MKLLCTICARGGSKGVPAKNKRIIAGKPLIAHSIEQAKKSGLFHAVVVSTDCDEIASIARQYGAHAWFKRPDNISHDAAAKIPVIRHAFIESEKYFMEKFDINIDLDATSPLRNVSDITGAYGQFLNDKADMLITGCPARKNPYFNMVEINKNSNPVIVKQLEKPMTRRQDAPRVYDMNASIYIWRRQALLDLDTLFTEKTSFYVMPENRSYDIDTMTDLHIVESFLSNKKTEEVF